MFSKGLSQLQVIGKFFFRNYSGRSKCDNLFMKLEWKVEVVLQLFVFVNHFVKITLFHSFFSDFTTFK